MENKKNELVKIIAKSYLAILLLTAMILILAFFTNRDVLANFLWQKYHNSYLALIMDRNDSDLAMFIGNYYFNGVIGGGEYDADIAFRAYQKAVSINQKILWGHYQLARIYFVKGNYNKALEEINKELNYNPENLRSLYVRGLIYGYWYRLGDLEKAEADFRRFTEWAPKEWAGYNDLAWILSKEGKYAEAEKTISSALKEAPDAKNNPWLWNSLGVAQLNLEKYSGAADSFKKAKKLAVKLTLEDWRHSYPGNDPATYSDGLTTFISTVNENLRRAGQ